MNIFKSLLPEITFLTGVTCVIVGMLVFMGWQVALLFTGAVLIIISNYLFDVCSVEVSE